MAEEVAAIAVEVLIDVIADMEAVGIESELAIALEATQDTLGEEITTDIATAVSHGSTPEAATSTALENSFQTISDISEEAANVWAENMQEEGYIFNTGEDPEVEDFEDTDPESNPDKGELDDPDCPDGSEDPTCLAKKQSKISEFFEWLKTKLSTIFGVSLGTGILSGIIAFFVFLGQAIRWLCQAWQRIFRTCDTNPQGGPNTTDQEDTCIDGKCDSQLCDAAKNVVVFVRKYWIPMLVITGISAAALTIYFKAMSPLITGAVVSGVIFLLTTILGNLAATTLCDLGASTCIFQGKPPNC
jgi:hypothetical protein